MVSFFIGSRLTSLSFHVCAMDRPLIIANKNQQELIRL
jgi:hypothetical protein